eukprot:2011288-Amphidinium_carterae.1
MSNAKKKSPSKKATSMQYAAELAPWGQYRPPQQPEGRAHQRSNSNNHLMHHASAQYSEGPSTVIVEKRQLHNEIE